MTLERIGPPIWRQQQFGIYSRYGLVFKSISRYIKRNQYILLGLNGFSLPLPAAKINGNFDCF